MTTHKEFEIRLFDQYGKQLLIVPVVAGTLADVEARAMALQLTHAASGFEVRGLMRSARYESGISRREL